ncbi:hypothetical protein HD554DRAFT_1158189 [Boletus coccyginus]|nr:hypothetical protein HD554DRAFT_1158189 [Boletus coccyginus]
MTSHSSLAKSLQGRRSLFYLIVPCSRRHFTLAQIAVMSGTDDIHAEAGKRNSMIRESEIWKAAGEGLLRFMAENGAETARDTGRNLLVLDIMLYAKGDKSSATKALAKALASPYLSEDPTLPHSIDLPYTSRMYSG